MFSQVDRDQLLLHISVLYTFSNTLAQFMPLIFDRNSDQQDSSKTHIAVLGARAEASMPIELWQQNILVPPSSSALHLHMIGPEIQIPPHATVQNEIFEAYSSSKFAISLCNSCYPLPPASKAQIPQPDAFVFFNSGEKWLLIRKSALISQSYKLDRNRPSHPVTRMEQCFGNSIAIWPPSGRQAKIIVQCKSLIKETLSASLPSMKMI